MIINYFRTLTVFILILLSLSLTVPFVNAATSPSLGVASSFAILSSTYSNTVAGTTLFGDLGYTTGPAVNPTVNGTTYIAPNAMYSQAITDKLTAYFDVNSQPCTFTFLPGDIDLASDTTHGAIGIYAPGVYCIDGNADIGGGGTITLSGSGTFIFRATGALTTSSTSIVTLTNGAGACDVWWIPVGATTLGAASTFIGNVMDDAGITVGNNVNWTGRAMSPGGTVSTANDTITVPNCSSPTPTPVPASNSNQSSNSNNGSTNNSCVASKITATPTIIDTRRISSSSVLINWGPDQGMTTFTVQYGLENGVWLYSTKVTGFSTTINNLPENTPIWVRVAATDNCINGAFSAANLSGNPHFPKSGLGQYQKFLYSFNGFF